MLSKEIYDSLVAAILKVPTLSCPSRSKAVHIILSPSPFISFLLIPIYTNRKILSRLLFTLISEVSFLESFFNLIWPSYLLLWDTVVYLLESKAFGGSRKPNRVYVPPGSMYHLCDNIQFCILFFFFWILLNVLASWLIVLGGGGVCKKNFWFFMCLFSLNLDYIKYLIYFLPCNLCFCSIPMSYR